MNKKRREKISKIVENLEFAKMEIESVLSDEESALDNLPESIRDSERGMDMEESIDALNDAVGYFDDLIDSLNTAKS